MQSEVLCNNDIEATITIENLDSNKSEHGQRQQERGFKEKIKV
jgi:hypothetical protein